MPIEQYTYWSITINNPDENDYLIIRNPNSKYIREMVWTPEIGEEGTKHIQGWIRLQRNQGMTFVKKLYPRAHLKPCDKDAYNENCHSYAQKNDDTTAGNHHIKLFDPLPANDSLLYQVLDKAYDRLMERNKELRDELEHEGFKSVIQSIHLKLLWTDLIEREMVMERSGLEKIFTSPAYERMKVKFWKEILFRLKHKQDVESLDNEEREASDQVENSEYSDSYEEGESSTDEGSTEGSSYQTDEEYDSEGDGE